MDNKALLTLKNLNVWYTRGKPVLKNFSLELGANGVVRLIGLNGAGKTTFIKTLSGLLDSFQMEGIKPYPYAPPAIGWHCAPDRRLRWAEHPR